MTAASSSGRCRSAEAIVFDVLLAGFAALIVLSALGLRAGAGSVPLLVGVPTLVGALGVLVRDVRGRPPGSADAERGGVAGGLQELVAAARAEDEDDVDLPVSAEERRRQLIFAAWTGTFVLLAALTSFYIATPIALVALLAWIRLPRVAIALIVAVAMAMLYGLFGLFLNVRF